MGFTTKGRHKKAGGGVSGSGDSASTGGSFSIPAFGFTLQALQTTSNVNVLSTPHILTVENEEAEIQVGKRQPYRNQSMGGLGNLSSLAGLAGGAGRPPAVFAAWPTHSAQASISGLEKLESSVEVR